jgi:peptide methionine sulfoxide reductase MsrB
MGKHNVENIRYGKGVIEIPEKLVLCPECGGTIFIGTDGWDSETGWPTEDSFDYSCEQNEREQQQYQDDEIEFYNEHRWWQSDWQPVRDKIWTWLEQQIQQFERKQNESTKT